MDIYTIITDAVREYLKNSCGIEPEEKNLQIQKTRKEFAVDLTLVVFPLLTITKKSPEQTAEEIGSHLVENYPEFESFNVIKGFLNLVVSQMFWTGKIEEILQNKQYGTIAPDKHSPDRAFPIENNGGQRLPGQQSKPCK